MGDMVKVDLGKVDRSAAGKMTRLGDQVKGRGW
jgi:hypothetical protein